MELILCNDNVLLLDEAENETEEENEEMQGV